MVKLLSLILYKWKEENSVEVANCSELSSFSFFHRGPMREHIKFHSRLIVSRTPLGRRLTVDFDQNLGKCHTWVHPQGLGAAVLIDAEYPPRVAFSLLSEAVRIFMEKMDGQWQDMGKDAELKCPEVEELFQKFQNPAEADKLTKIEKDLEEVKETVLQSMDDLLKRGENLDQLMEKSKDLSNTSVQFYRTAKKNNQCCKLY
jgi:synaptobrevin family protein YKT6